MNKNPIGVVVARLQVPELHEGHRYLIDEVKRRHGDILIVLGCCRSRPTPENPLDYALREQMVNDHYPFAQVRPIFDNRSDEAWSAELDQLIAKSFPGRTAILYGSRSSFLERYTGALLSVTIPPIEAPTGTNVRQGLDLAPVASANFRAGIIYAENKREARAYQTIDVAIFNENRTAVLLGGRNSDEGKLRFIGGFVDPSDLSLEYAVRREVSEEAGDIQIDDICYLGSRQQDDWRYRTSQDRIITTFFTAKFIYGRPEARDDIDRVAWVNIDQLRNIIVEEHLPLVEMLEKSLTTK